MSHTINLQSTSLLSHSKKFLHAYQPSKRPSNFNALACAGICAMRDVHFPVFTNSSKCSKKKVSSNSYQFSIFYSVGFCILFCSVIWSNLPRMHRTSDFFTLAFFSRIKRWDYESPQYTPATVLCNQEYVLYSYLH